MSDNPKFDAALARIGVAAPILPRRARKPEATRMEVTRAALKRQQGITPLELAELFEDYFGRGKGKMSTARLCLHKAGGKALRRKERRLGFSVYQQE